jgi:hypothetical protein
VAQSLSSAGEQNPLSNSAARAGLIRDAARWLAEREAEVKAINADIAEYKSKHIKGDLGFKIADWNAIYRVSQLEIEDRDQLLDTLREGFAALNIGQVVDWVDAAQRAPRHAEADEEPRAAGLGGVMDHKARYPRGEPGHADYELGLGEGQDERDRIEALGEGESGNGHANGAGEAAPRRGRGRPRKTKDAGAEA